MRVLLPVLVGPTGIGKTRVATALAHLADIEIISADSRQVYRGLDIGTAKPVATDRAAAVYHGLDLVEPQERYSAGRFARDATEWIAGITARGRLPLLVGGTGFYLRALFDGLFAEPALDPARRARLGRVLAGLSAGELARWAGRLDAGFKGGGAQRAARTATVALLTGRSLTGLQRGAPAAPAVWTPWYAQLTLPRAALASRIAQRTEAMLAAGLVQEVQAVLRARVPPSAPGLTGVGYREVVQHLEGRLDDGRLAAVIAQATRRYAKRQETWFRHQLNGPVAALDAEKDPETLAREVLSGYRAACA